MRCDAIFPDRLLIRLASLGALAVVARGSGWIESRTMMFIALSFLVVGAGAWHWIHQEIADFARR